MSNEQLKSAKKDFTKTFRGYSPEEVDEYIAKLSEKYTALYHENADLQAKLSAAKSRLTGIETEEEQVRKSLEIAKKAGDKIVSEAYEKADEIMAALRRNCDIILNSFREKIQTQRNNLQNVQENAFGFKRELFERYRQHIELVDNLIPAVEYEELTNENYIEKVVTNIKEEISTEYDVKIEDLLTEDEKTVNLVKGIDKLEKEMSQTPEEDAVVKKVAEIKKAEAKKAKKEVSKPVMNLLDEVEDIADTEVNNFGKQMTLDIDDLLNNN